MWPAGHRLDTTERVCLREKCICEKSSMKKMKILAEFQCSDLPVASYGTNNKIHNPVWWWSSPYLLPCLYFYHTCHFSQDFLFLELAKLPSNWGSLHLLFPLLKMCSPPDSHAQLLSNIQISAQISPRQEASPGLPLRKWHTDQLSCHAFTFTVLFSPWHQTLSKITFIIIIIFVYCSFFLLPERRESGCVVHNYIYSVKMLNTYL